MNRIKTVALAACVAALLVACASLSIKERVALTLQSAHRSAVQAQTVEQCLWNREVATQDGLACASVPVAPLPASYTAADHQAFNAALRDFFSAEIPLAQALQTWAPGNDPPETLVETIAAVQNAVDAVAVLTPHGAFGNVVPLTQEVLRFLLNMHADMVAGGGQ